MNNEPPPSVATPYRWLLATGGVVCVALGSIGVLLPGLPTTPFLLAASYLFARSSPRLQRWMTTRPWLRPYLDAVRGDAVVSRRARLIAVGVLWASLGSTLFILHRTVGVGPAVLVPLALVGGAVLIWYRDR